MVEINDMVFAEAVCVFVIPISMKLHGKHSTMFEQMIKEKRYFSISKAPY